MQRSEEHDKAKYMAAKAEEEQQSTTSGITTKALDKKRRLEEEAKNKVGTQQLRAVAECLARSISRLAVLAQEQPEMMRAAPSPPAPSSPYPQAVSSPALPSPRQKRRWPPIGPASQTPTRRSRSWRTPR